MSDDARSFRTAFSNPRRPSSSDVHVAPQPSAAAPQPSAGSAASAAEAARDALGRLESARDLTARDAKRAEPRRCLRARAIQIGIKHELSQLEQRLRYEMRLELEGRMQIHNERCLEKVNYLRRGQDQREKLACN